MVRKLRSSIILTVGILLSGCYTYTPVPIAQTTPGEEVRIRISAERAAELQQILQREDRVLIGEVVINGPEDLLLEVPSAAVASAGSVSRLNQRLTFTHADIVEVEARKLDRLRTAGVAAVIAAAGTYLAIRAFAYEGNPDADGGKGGTDQILIPVFRLTW